MDLTKVRKQPVLVAVLIGIVLLALLGAGLSRQAIPLPPAPAPEAVSEQTVQPVQPAGAEAAKTHTVGEGETLSGIAEAYHIDVDTLLGANPEAGETLYPGDQLLILPQKGVLHTVSSGDSLWRISNIYNVEISAILAANAKNGEGLAIGEKLFVPGGKPVAAAVSSVAVSRASVSRFNWPASGEISSPFGMRWGRMHAGIDIANDTGTPVTAAMSGRVTYAGWYGGYGYALILEHNNGYSTLYGHLSGFAVSSGQHVRTGQQIAFVGNTGYSTGPHLHFEVRKDGQPVNPMNFLP